MLTWPVTCALHPRRTGPGFGCPQAFCSSGRPAPLYWPGRPEAFGLGVILNVVAGPLFSPRPGRGAGPRSEESLRSFSPRPTPWQSYSGSSSLRQNIRSSEKPAPLFSMRCALLCEPHLTNGPLFSYSCALLLPQLPRFDSHATCPMCFLPSSVPNWERARASCTSPQRKKSRASSTSPRRNWYLDAKIETRKRSL